MLTLTGGIVNAFTRSLVVLLVAAVMVAAVIATVWLIRVEREQQPVPVKDPVATQAAPKPEPGAAPRRDPEVRRRAEIGLSPH